MRVIKGKSFADVYKQSLQSVIHNPEFITSPRDMLIKEVTNMALVIENPELCLYDNKKRSSQYKYIAAELLFYFSGRKDLKFIEKYAAFWRQIANPDETLNSAYGNLIFTQKNQSGLSQWQWAMQSIIKDKNTRQAVMLFSKPQYQYKENKDVICTLSGLFNIRNNKLNFKINMRSNDVILGTPTDIAFFCLLQQQALILLREYYPELELGTYTHIADSYHIYERHFKLVEEMLESDFDANAFPEIKINFIDIDGNTTESFNKLMHSVEKCTNLETNDHFFRTIKTTLTEDAK